MGKYYEQTGHGGPSSLRVTTVEVKAVQQETEKLLQHHVDLLCTPSNGAVYSETEVEDPQKAVSSFGQVVFRIANMGCCTGL